jgi:protein TonB
MEPSPIVSATPAPSTKDATPPGTRKTVTAQSATSTATAQSNTPPQAIPISAASAPAVPAPAPVTLELPSSDAQYLQNPKPNYPNQSKRLSEQGTVLIRVLVSDKGAAKEAHIQTSSGFFRLDNAALSTVLTWRFVPGKRAGIAESMWFTVPIRFGLQ